MCPRDETVSDDFNRAENRDYGVTDASITYTNEKSGLKIALFGKNVFDEVYYDFGTNFSSSILGIQTFWLTPPRTYGLQLTYEM